MTPKRFRAIKALWNKKEATATPTARAFQEMKDSSFLKRMRTDKALMTEVIARFQAKEPGVSELILKAHLPLMLKIVSRHGRAAPHDQEDLLQVARLALLEGCARFNLEGEDDKKGSLAFLWIYVKSYVSRSLLDEGAVVKIPIHRFSKKNKETLHERAPGYVDYRMGKRYVMNFSEMADENEEGMEYSFQDALVSDAAPPDQVLDDVWLRRRLDDSVHRMLQKGFLSARERDVLAARMDGATLKELGDDWGYSRERIRQIEATALAKLRMAAGPFTRAKPSLRVSEPLLKPEKKS